MIVRQAIVDDFVRLDLQPMQALRSVDLNLVVGRMALRISHALTVLDAEKTPLSIAGVTETGSDTVFVWVLLSARAKKHMLALTRILKQAMHDNTRGYKFVETLVRSDFGPGHRWAKMFGFECVQPGRSKDPDGNTEDLYRRAA